MENGVGGKEVGATTKGSTREFFHDNRTVLDRGGGGGYKHLYTA